jgi:two-component system sensor histidine kinase ChvG
MAFFSPRNLMQKKSHSTPSARTRLVSPLTRRILSVNVLALAILAAGSLYLAKYETNLIDAERQTLRNQGEIFAEALGQGGWRIGSSGASELYPSRAAPMLRRLVSVTSARVRLYDSEGNLLADSRQLLGSDGGIVDISDLPPPQDRMDEKSLQEVLYEKLVLSLPSRSSLAPYTEPFDGEAGGYPEVRKALLGIGSDALRISADGHLVLTSAVPVQRFKKILGVVLLSSSGKKIDEAIKEIRLDILKVFAGALAITILLSFYLARSIVRPLRVLAMAATRLKMPSEEVPLISGFENRNDEIGELATDLNVMTRALYERLDAIECFAADVAHEIKNPLTSLRSAVETAARIKDTNQQKKLMEIIQEDVLRLDRLISDISAASRLDTALSREKKVRLDITLLLRGLVNNYRDSGENAVPIVLESAEPQFFILGERGRLIQVFDNIIMNAFSFVKTNGQITIGVRSNERWVEVIIEDDGPGIPSGSLSRIFDRFYTERPDSEKFGTHSGLGLSISKQIVLAHGGEIIAENRADLDTDGQGARFTVRLPQV